MATPTSFLVLSDTHNFERDASQPYPLCQKIPKVDVVLHCGDLTQVGGVGPYKRALKMLGDLDAELKLVIAGNHDLSLDSEYWKTQPEEDQEDEKDDHKEAVDIMQGSLAKAANVTYLTEGLYTFSLKNGATFKIFVSPYQPECGEWAFGYKRGEKRWNIPTEADIVMTHGPPQGSLDFTGSEHAGCEDLHKAIESTQPLMHCFGHIHEGYGAMMKDWANDGEISAQDAKSIEFSKAGTDEKVVTASHARGQNTLMVNAAIMDEGNKPVNAPWFVRLPL
ncbi:uncharacterized protein MYCFIDRAFT_64415 [Pseudocercospora fijiensis CIRAD86]|uniref:Calcineurin-like phosphoesterase domain-containing protein n=1 Tax=Pseudocercospora fijiensis (strain CIRAD86) TaxID=383855 RepID=M2YQA3_PSEFD|nr:uncharacterized protein MYCFIDRAFT_64415 [Pseudocercospora fijiensis CIRAD86]EME79900.1 hypothetical protein MYCFIDRAFT_64415 [Pseudocercospora fijiensis CIRAD86]